MLNTNNMRGFLILVALVSIDVVNGYAKIADEMTCANGDCSDIISQGSAKIGYRPKDKTFLNMKKGDTVLVKAKNAGVKTNLWAGQPFLKGSKEDENKKSIISGGQKLIIEKPAVKPAATEQRRQQQINNADDDPEKAVKVVDNSNNNNNNKQRDDDDNTDEEKFDSRKDAIVKSFQNFPQDTGGKDDSTIKTAPDETAASSESESQVSTVDDIQTVGDKQEVSEPAELIKKLINSTSPSKEKSDERIQMFLDLVAPNSIEGKESEENDRNYLIKQNMKAKVVPEENEDGGEKVVQEKKEEEENMKAQVVQESQEVNVRDEGAKAVQEDGNVRDKGDDGSGKNVGEHLVVVSNDEATHKQEDNQQDNNQQVDIKQDNNQQNNLKEDIQQENNQQNDNQQENNQQNDNQQEIGQQNDNQQNNNQKEDSQQNNNQQENLIQNEDKNNNEQENQQGKNKNDKITENGETENEQQNNQKNSSHENNQQTQDEDDHKTETNGDDEDKSEQPPTNVTGICHNKLHVHVCCCCSMWWSGDRLLELMFDRGVCKLPSNHHDHTTSLMTTSSSDQQHACDVRGEIFKFHKPLQSDAGAEINQKRQQICSVWSDVFMFDKFLVTTAASHAGFHDINENVQQISSIWKEIFKFDKPLQTNLDKFIEINENVEKICSIWKDIFKIDKLMQTQLPEMKEFTENVQRISSIWKEIFKFDKPLQTNLDKLTELSRNLQQISSIWKEIFKFDKPLQTNVIEINDNVQNICSIWKEIFKIERPLQTNLDKFIEINENVEKICSIWKDIFKIDKLMQTQLPEMKEFTENVQRISSIWREIFKFDKPLVTMRAGFDELGEHLPNTCSVWKEIFKFDKPLQTNLHKCTELRRNLQQISSIWKEIFKFDKPLQTNMDKFIENVKYFSSIWKEVFKFDKILITKVPEFKEIHKNSPKICTVWGDVFLFDRKLLVTTAIEAAKTNTTPTSCNVWKDIFKFDKPLMTNLGELEEPNDENFTSIWKVIFKFDKILMTKISGEIEELTENVQQISSIWKEIFKFDKMLTTACEINKVPDTHSPHISSVWEEIFKFDRPLQTKMVTGFENSIQQHESKISSIWQHVFKFERPLSCQPSSPSTITQITKSMICEHPLLKYFTRRQQSRKYNLIRQDAPPDERRRSHHPLAVYFTHGTSPHNHMTSQRWLTWKARDDMQSKLADEGLVAYFLPGRRGDRSIASDYDDDGNAIWEEGDWDEEDEWAEEEEERADEEEEERVSTDQLVLLNNKRRLLEDRENILNVDTHEQQARIRGKLASVIDLMKQFTADLNTDVKYKATQEVREIKSDFELLEKRLKLLGRPEPSVKLEDDETANYVELNEVLERRSAVIKEKEDSLVDARRFGADLIDAADDIETAIRRDREDSVGYKQVIEQLEKELDARHARDERKIIEMEKDAGETRTKLAELQQEMRYNGTDELQQAATALKHRLKSLDTAVEERWRKEEDMIARNATGSLHDRISTMEHKLKERKAEEENLLQVQEEASMLKQELRQINHKFRALLEDRELQDRITSLEDELRERKLNETQKQHATQQTISELMGKVADLEQGKYDTQHSSELKTLKSQLESLMAELKGGGGNKEETDEDKQQQATNIKLQERVDLLERQLLEEKMKKSDDVVFDDVSKRLKDLEAYVDSKEQESTTTEGNHRVGKDEIVKVLREVASDKGNMLRLVTTNQQDEEQQDLMESIVAATDDDDVSDDVVEKNDEVEIPPPQAEETITKQTSTQGGGYIDLHEGKIVDWDESVEGKPRKKVTQSPTSSTWDETIGGDDEENENSQDNEEKEQEIKEQVEEIKEEEQQENAEQIEKSKENNQGEEEDKKVQLEAPRAEPIEMKQQENPQQEDKQQEKIKQEEDRQQEKKFEDPTGEQVTIQDREFPFADKNDTKTDEKHESRRSIDDNDVQPDSTRNSEQVTTTQNQFPNDPFAHVDARPPATMHEIKIEGLMVELMYLLVQLPSDLKHIMEPLVVYAVVGGGLKQ